MSKATPMVRAAQAANKILAYRAQCEAELEGYPETIKAKYAAKENKVKASLPEDVRGLLEKLLAE